MTDFLDRLEADLRTAAEQRGRRRPNRALKVVVAIAAVAILVIAGISALPSGESRPAVPQLDRKDADVAVIPAGQAGITPAVATELARRGYLVGGPLLTAPDDMSSAALYRPGAENVARSIAKRLGIEARPLTTADEQRLGGRLRTFDAIVVFGFDLQDRMLSSGGRCQAAGGDLRLCTVHRDVTINAFYDGDRRVRVESPGDVGHWRWAALSPDGRTILAQWSAECEVPQAFMIDASGGRPRLVGDVSEALGWTESGEAIVYLPPDRGCGGSPNPGVYLVSPSGDRRPVPTSKPKRSIHPRTDP